LLNFLVVKAGMHSGKFSADRNGIYRTDSFCFAWILSREHLFRSFNKRICSVLCSYPRKFSGVDSRL